MEQYLREKGELPLNLHLDSSRTYQAMTGQSEIMLDGRGLPQRLTIHLDYPQEKDDARTQADVTTDFVFPADKVAAAGQGSS